MSYERPQRFVGTTHKGNGGWIHAAFWALVGLGVIFGGASQLGDHPAHRDDDCAPVVVRPETADAARTLMDAGWVDPAGTGETIYPPGCDAHR